MYIYIGSASDKFRQHFSPFLFFFFFFFFFEAEKGFFKNDFIVNIRVHSRGSYYYSIYVLCASYLGVEGGEERSLCLCVCVCLHAQSQKKKKKKKKKPPGNFFGMISFTFKKIVVCTYPNLMRERNMCFGGKNTKSTYIPPPLFFFPSSSRLPIRSLKT